MFKKIMPVIFLFAVLSPGWSSVAVEGVFVAKQACPAYLSKHHKTNPDQQHTLLEARYALVELNRARQPDWYRIRLAHSSNPLRWVHQSCGQAEYGITAAPGCQQSAGNADSHVLALSWQPAFCETYGYEANKAECRPLAKHAFSQQHLTLHGLWPNQKACGKNYGFCGVSARSHHCAYPGLTLAPEISERLQQYMPSFASGSCLERHEWNKHGSCQLQAIDPYFNLALDLAQEADRSPLADLIREYRGGTVSLKRLQQASESSFGPGSRHKIYFGCSQGKLVDIFLQLPLQLHQNDGLAALLQQASGEYRRQGCPKMVAISDFYSSDS
ncbi:MAG: ribonuclease T [Legionellaceae bacterium]|nr:ribonuclease T [Legionellaceae bacterium]